MPNRLETGPETGIPQPIAGQLSGNRRTADDEAFELREIAKAAFGIESALRARMACQLRWYLPNVIYEATTRTIQERFLLRPSAESRALILGVIGRAMQRNTTVQVYAFVFLSNHYHMMVSAADPEELALFFGFVNGNISREMGRIHGWRGSLWGRRVRPTPILDPEAAVARLRYVLSNGVKEGLVASPCEWPGATAVQGLLGDMRLEGVWVDRDSLRRARLKDPEVTDDAFSSTVEVKLSPLPQWEGLDANELRQKYEGLVRDVEAEGERLGLAFLGARRVMSEDPHASPEQPARRRAPLCHTTSVALRRAFKEAYRTFVAAYRDAVARVRTRAATYDVHYPEGSFPRPRMFRRVTPPLDEPLAAALDRIPPPGLSRATPF